MAPNFAGDSPRPLPAYRSPIVARLARRLGKVFAGLDSRSYLGEDARAEFRFYDELFEEALVRIDRRVAAGAIRPCLLRRRGESRLPEAPARVGAFIGSFDPFQMTHLAAALRFLASDRAAADVVVVIPEGGENPAKPKKTDYRFRFELLRLQLESVFSPLILPLDLGEGADTIGIVERLIAQRAGGRLALTHPLGSDSLPLAARFLPEDLAAWRRAAAEGGVDLDFGAFAVLREEGFDLSYAEAGYGAHGVRFAADERPLGTPSSTDFRSRGALTIVLPTDAVLGRLELLFRYAMNRPWMGERSAARRPEYEI